MTPTPTSTDADVAACKRHRAQLVLPQGAWPSLLAFLLERFKGLSESQIRQRLLKGDMFLVEGRSLSAESPYPAGQRLYYHRHLEPEAPVPGEIGIVHQDENILVADKPPFMAVLPAGNHFEQTLTVQLRQMTGLQALTPAHRIDRDTTGLVLFTKTKAVRGAYQSLFERQAISKHYEAIAPIAPHLQFPFLAEHHLVENPRAFMQMQVVPQRPTNARCHIHLLQTQGPLARYRIALLTGKKHQIRAQFSALGIPLKNDRIYPNLAPHAPGDFGNPLRLLASHIAFDDPLSGHRWEFASRARLAW
jgi:tRNA pseudouridine32 synthase / 23S rRNA pseudouridine746 synthase